MDEENKRIIIDQGHYSEAEYPFKIEANFGTLGSIIEIKPQGSIIGFVYDDSIRNLLGFHETMLFKEYTLSDNPVDILSFDNIFIHTDIAKGMIPKIKRSGTIHNFTMDVDPGYKNIDRFRGGVQWYMMESKNIISSLCFKLKNANNELVSFNGQNIYFTLSVN